MTAEDGGAGRSGAFNLRLMPRGRLARRDSGALILRKDARGR